MFYAFNTAIRFGAEKSSNSTGNAKPTQPIMQVPSSATSAHKSQVSKDSLPKGSPAPLGVKSKNATKDSPPEIPPPQPKSLPDKVKSMSDVELNNLIAKLINVVGRQQAHLNDQQAQLNDLFKIYSQNSYNAHEPIENHIPHEEYLPPEEATLPHNPFAEAEGGASAIKALIPSTQTMLKVPLRFLATLFPIKYLKNLPMNFLKSLVQSGGSTLGSRVAETAHDKYIHPLFFKKPPPPKRSPVKDAFKDASRLIPEFFFRSVIDNTTNRFAHKLIP